MTGKGVDEEVPDQIEDDFEEIEDNISYDDKNEFSDNE